MSLEKINHDEFPSTETILKVNHDALKRGGLDLEMDHVVSVIGHHRLKASLAKTDQSLSLSDTFVQSWMNSEPSGRRVFLVNAGRHILFSNLYRKVLVTEPFRGSHGMSGAALTGEGRQDVNMGCNFWFENPKEMIRNGQVKESHAGEMMSCAEQGEEQTSMGRLGVYMAARKKT